MTMTKEEIAAARERVEQYIDTFPPPECECGPGGHDLLVIAKGVREALDTLCATARQNGKLRFELEAAQDLLAIMRGDKAMVMRENKWLREAVEPPESLVGKRVSFHAFSTTLVGRIVSDERVLRVKHSGSQAGATAPGECSLFLGDDFNLMEDGDE